MLKPKTLGLWANTDKDIFWNILPEIVEWADRKKIQIFMLLRNLFQKKLKKNLI